MPAAHEELEGRLRVQARGCIVLGSPFYGALLESAADDLNREGPVWELLAEFEAESESSALALRLMAAVHRLVLQDRLPQLTSHYPSVGGDGDAAMAWPLFRNALTEHRGAIEIAKQMPATVERLDAATFLERELGAPWLDTATVVYHSVFIQYLTDEKRSRIAAIIGGAVSRAAPGAPVYHLSMEPDEARFELRLDDELLGTSRAHGTEVVWLA